MTPQDLDLIVSITLMVLSLLALVWLICWWSTK